MRTDRSWERSSVAGQAWELWRLPLPVTASGRAWPTVVCTGLQPPGGRRRGRSDANCCDTQADQLGCQQGGYQIKLTKSSKIVVIGQSFPADFVFFRSKEFVPSRVFVYDSLDTQFEPPHLP